MTYAPTQIHTSTEPSDTASTSENGTALDHWLLRCRLARHHELVRERVAAAINDLTALSRERDEDVEAALATLRRLARAIESPDRQDKPALVKVVS